VRKRKLGKTGIELSELSLGTWGLSGDAYGPVEAGQEDAVLERARALGITLFETADSYARGAMELKLGERLSNDTAARFLTKIGTDRRSSPPKKCFTREFLRESLDKSRERLKRSTIDIVLLHNPSPRAFERDPSAAQILGELKAEGALLAWGASVGDAATARAAIEAGAEVIELAYNVFSSQDLHQIQTEVREKEVGVFARTVLAHGLLCGNWSRFKAFPVGDHRRDRWTTDQLKKRIDQVPALRVLMGDDIQTLRAGALRYALANEAVSTVVIGPRNSVQLDQLVREAGKGPPYIPDDRLQKLGARLSDLGVLP
jgi:aryl-alcohol dehydrogenase-like predicted oxidoreductase